ncbi:hypothetical protein BGZ95_002672 [Linnemannia exigua]|uniref:F-box domain-containing protein n=1 Tax=Linnemannia exigua TaxID=604196 RepID=A0AAD4H2T2_9FUNG|nr:hypothetical protein BGZ95_002672 [Linnemannia exigua]
MNRPKYFHQLSPPPLDLPEIIDRIRADLSLTDIWKCTQVCSIWSHQFSPFLWETFHYNRLEHQDRLERNGHHIRQLITFSLRDSDLKTISQHLRNLTGVTLDIETLDDPSALFEFYASVASSLKRLSIQLPNPSELGSFQKALLFPVAQGALANLTKLQLIGMDNRRYAPIYQSGMILRVLEACPLLEYVELSAIRIVDTMKQWVESYQNSFSSPNSIPVPTRRLAPQPPAVPPSTSWVPWKWTSATPPGGHAHPAILLDYPSNVDTKEAEVYDAQKLPEPYADFKCRHLRVLKLLNIYSRQTTGFDFTNELLQRSPNLSQLYLKSAPANLLQLATLCPDLRLISLQDYPQNQPYPQPHISTYLSSPAGKLKKLSTVRLEKCCITSYDLQNVQVNLKKRGLKHLSVMKCEGSSAMAWANFIRQCEALETVSVDDLLCSHTNEMVLNLDNPIRTGLRQQREAIPSAIRWGCNQIRYLDIYGHQGREAAFDYVFLVLVTKLPFLEFLGMNSAHVAWLMKMEPLQVSRVPGSMATTMKKWEDPLSERLPLGLFESVKTLSIEASNRRDTYFGQASETVLTLQQVQYLYHAFPALETIVYNAVKCPCLTDAIQWLKQTPRDIHVVHRSSTQLEAQSLGL